MATVILIALSLAMDAFSVSVTNGMCMKNIKIKEALLIAFVYGFFQFIMPMAGYFGAYILKDYIEKVDHWIAFVILFFIGFKMITEAIEELKEKSECKIKDISFKVLIIQGIATSIDALAAGIGLVALNIPILSSVSIIGLITFTLCFTGVYLGKKMGGYLKGKAEILGGVILILIGLKILIEHLFF